MLVASRRCALCPRPDIALFVSRNAVAHGLALRGRLPIDRRYQARQRRRPSRTRGQYGGYPAEAAGFDSESLLQEPASAGQSRPRISALFAAWMAVAACWPIRCGRAARHVDYLSVYERGLPEIGNDALSQLEADWLAGRINVITVMSIETLDNLLAVLPDSLRQKFAAMPLVTPAARVLKEVHNRYPACNASLASGTEAGNILNAIIALHRTDPD